MNEWMNDFLQKEHTGPPRTCGILFLTRGQALNLCIGSTDSRTLDYKRPNPAAAAKSLQSCPTLCDPMDCSLPGFSVHGILQARTQEWVAISFSNA